MKSLVQAKQDTFLKNFEDISWYYQYKVYYLSSVFYTRNYKKLFSSVLMDVLAVILVIMAMMVVLMVLCSLRRKFAQDEDVGFPFLVSSTG